MISSFIIPIFIILLISYSVIKRKNAYSSFVFGAKSSFDLVLTSFPYIVAIFIAIELFTVSGLSTILGNVLAPIFGVLGIPNELIELVLIKPFSGNGSLAILTEIFTTHGVDSYISRCACVIYGSSETVFYIAAVYFAGAKTKKLTTPITISLIASFCSCVFACFICKII